MRPVVTKGVSQSFEFVGRIKAIDKVELRARIEGFLEKVLFRRARTSRRATCSTGSRRCSSRRRSTGQGKLLLPKPSDQCQAAIRPQLELSKRQFSPQARSTRTRRRSISAAARSCRLQAALKQAQLNLGYTDIRAPIDGRIGRTAFTVGNLVNPASGVLATIVSQDPIYVLFPVSVRDLETIREARRKEGGGLAKIDIRLRLSNGQDYPHPGTWNFTDPQVEQQTDSLIMRATMPNPERTLVDGQFVTAVIRERKEEPRLVIPQAALQVDQSGYYALVVTDQHKVEQRRIQTGPNLGTDVVVTSGVREGDKVIVDGIQKVRPGQVVQETVLPPRVGG